MHLDALCCEQLHFFFDEREDEDLFILIQNTITALVKDVDELHRRVQPQHVADVITTLLEQKTHVCVVQ